MAERPKRLYRIRKGRKVVGVLGGIADYFGLDPSLVRIAYVFITFFTLGIPGIVLYLAMAFIVPLEPKAQGRPV
jgi:phage shock protein C